MLFPFTTIATPNRGKQIRQVPEQVWPATAAEFTQLGIAAPDHIWLCDEASGNLIDELASLALTPLGFPGYERVVDRFPDELSVLTVAATFPYHGFTNASAIDPGSANTSYLLVVQNGGAGNIFFSIATDSVRVQMNGTKIRIGIAANQTEGTAEYPIGETFPVLVAVDPGNSITVYTDREEFNFTAAAVPDPLTGFTGLGSGGASVATMNYLYLAHWAGQLLGKSDVDKFWREPLSY